MRFPKPPYTPPRWYWRLPLRWRQRYCRWIIWKWEAAYSFCTNILSRRTLFHHIPGAIGWTLYCIRFDHKQRMPIRESLGYLGGYWKICWQSWLHPLPQEALA